MSDALTPGSDAVVPFIFEKLPVRGALIQLQHTWARMQLGQDYSDPVTTILGEAAAATGLIAQSLKFDGTITLQVTGEGPLSMLVMQSTDQLELRGMASALDVADDIGFAELVQKSRCAITVDNDHMEQPYQGIVEMLGDSLSHSLANYFSRSAQIQSHIVLLATRAICGGILLQLMPEKTEPVLADDWRRMGLLAGTLRAADLREGIDAGLVGRMFAEDDIRVFQARPAAFRCRCSRERAEEVLQLLGETETTSACKEQGRLEVICEYCGRKETFDAIDIGRLFAGQPQQGSDSLH